MFLKIWMFGFRGFGIKMFTVYQSVSSLSVCLADFWLSLGTKGTLHTLATSNVCLSVYLAVEPQVLCTPPPPPKQGACSMGLETSFKPVLFFNLNENVFFSMRCPTTALTPFHQAPRNSFKSSTFSDKKLIWTRLHHLQQQVTLAVLRLYTGVRVKIHQALLNVSYHRQYGGC